MKHALFCWEYGAGMGHIGSLRMIARRLEGEWLDNDPSSIPHMSNLTVGRGI